MKIKFQKNTRIFPKFHSSWNRRSLEQAQACSQARTNKFMAALRRAAVGHQHCSLRNHRKELSQCVLRQIARRDLCLVPPTEAELLRAVLTLRLHSIPRRQNLRTLEKAKGDSERPTDNEKLKNSGMCTNLGTEIGDSQVRARGVNRGIKRKIGNGDDE